MCVCVRCANSSHVHLRWCRPLAVDDTFGALDLFATGPGASAGAGEGAGAGGASAAVLPGVTALLSALPDLGFMTVSTLVMPRSR